MSAYSQLQLVRIGMTAITVASAGGLVLYTYHFGLDALPWSRPRLAAGLLAAGGCAQFWAIHHFHWKPHRWAIIWTAISWANCGAYYFAEASLFNFHGHRHKVEFLLVGLTAGLTYKLANEIEDMDGDYWPNVVCRDSQAKARSKAMLASSIYLVGLLFALNASGF